MSLGHIAGLLFAFALALIPSGLFVGFLLGRALGLAAWFRWLATVVTAIWLAYGMVFHAPNNDDPGTDCVERSSINLPRC